jgi:hypothetical protein
VIVTDVPPAGGPAAGVTELTAGLAVYVYWSPALVALVATGVVTVTSTVPAVPAGAVALIVVALRTVKEEAAPAVPKVTAEAPVKLVPVMMTTVPAARGPEEGLKDVTVGAVS